MNAKFEPKCFSIEHQFFQGICKCLLNIIAINILVVKLL